MLRESLFVLAGAAGALILWVAVQSLARQPLRRYAVALLVTALLYVLFAAIGRSATGLAVEAVGVIAFGGAALLGIRRTAASIVAAGWALHPVWDVVLHSTGAGAAYTPTGYVAACIGFDLLLALLIVRAPALAGLRVATSRPGPRSAAAARRVPG